jgi:5-methyltetrahydropteroyltriglutamate--homocysteine methyltransferase
MLGVIDLSDVQVETPAIVAARIRRALPFVDPRHVVASTDCGMKYLPRDLAFAKMQSLVQGAKIVRDEINQGQTPSGGV